MKENTINNQTLFAFYGSLREGMGNHAWALAGQEGVTLVETTKLPGFKMYSLGFYPMVFLDEDKNNEIVVEVYKITDDEAKSEIDGMEIGAGYKRHLVTTESGLDVLIYVGRESKKPYFESGRSLVTSGDWVAHNSTPKTTVNEEIR